MQEPGIQLVGRECRSGDFSEDENQGSNEWKLQTSPVDLDDKQSGFMKWSDRWVLKYEHSPRNK